MRFVLVALLVARATAAAAAGGDVRAAKDPAAGFLHRRFQGRRRSCAGRGTLAEADGHRGCARARAGARWKPHARLPACARGLRGEARSRRGGRARAQPTGRLRRARPGRARGRQQTPATWGLDRIDQRDLPLNNTYNYNQTGQGVQAYIIDTGIRATHQQFAGRVGNGVDVVGTGRARTTATGTEPTSPGRSAERRTALPSRSRCTPSASSTAAAPGRTPASSRASTG